jgi:hypothetical protein
MTDLIAQTRAAFAADLYYISLFSALTIPDICGAFDSTDGVATGARYRDWYMKHVLPRYDVLSADECYHYRCTALHQGRSEPQKAKDYDRVLFIEPKAACRLHINVKRVKAKGDVAIMIHVEDLIEAILGAAEHWVASSRGTEPFESNHKRFMHRHPNGFLPFVSGVPVIT